MTSIRSLSVLAGWAALLLAGCLPVELEVGKDGQVLVPRQEGFFTLDSGSGKVVRVYKPASDQAAFGRFAPDGKHILAVSEAGGGGGSQTFEWVDLGDGSAKKLCAATNTAYATVSPDGKTAAFTRVSDEGTALGGDSKENLPELHLIDLAAGKDQLVKAAGAIAGIHRWFPDSKSLLLFQITGKVKEGNLHKGTLNRFEPATGKATPLAAALGSNNVFFALSPDGKTVLFTASAAGKPGAELKPGEGWDEQLFELKVETGDVRAVKKGVSYALWSPKGAKVLVAVKGEESKVKLEVADAALAKFTPLAEDAAASVSGGGDDTKIYPAWLSEDRIAYLALRAVYGRAGKNLELVFIDADGKNRKAQQAALDAEAGKAEK
ncbi:MAG: hypothetical protein PHU85_03000 [Phycisphaerae bacterium]|nr:hypothetical protein [Phycisphaerae bacterium]